MEALLHGGGEQAVAEDVLRAVLGQLQVVHARVDGREAAVVAVHFAHDGEARLQVGESARRQRRAACGELQERLALVAAHRTHDVDEALEAGTASTKNAT